MDDQIICVWWWLADDGCAIQVEDNGQRKRKTGSRLAGCEFPVNITRQESLGDQYLVTVKNGAQS